MAENMEDRVRDVISDHLGIDLDKVIPSATLEDDLGGDSLDRVEIIMALEDEFSIEINDEEYQACHTVQDTIDLVRKKTS